MTNKIELSKNLLAYVSKDPSKRNSIFFGGGKGYENKYADFLIYEKV